MIFDILETNRKKLGGVETLILTLAEQPTMIGTAPMRSPFRMPYSIPSPTAAQIAEYDEGKTITLMPVEPAPAPAQPAASSGAPAAAS